MLIYRFKQLYFEFFEFTLPHTQYGKIKQKFDSEIKNISKVLGKKKMKNSNCAEHYCKTFHQMLLMSLSYNFFVLLH